MSRVVERCTVCGTEHSLAHEGPCEACGGDLGFWCTRHGPKTGWLPDRVCPVCAAEATRAAPPPPRPAPSPRATPAPAPPPEAPRPHRRPPVDAPPMEVPPMEAPPPRRPRRPRRPVDAGPPMAPEPSGPVLRDGMARHLPGIAAGGASFAWRLVMAFFAVARATIFWGLLGGLLGLGYGLFATGTDLDGGLALHTIDPQVLWMGAFGMMAGGALGFLLGLVRAQRILFSAPRE